MSHDGKNSLPETVFRVAEAAKVMATASKSLLT